jgi:hypothetical protein
MELQNVQDVGKSQDKHFVAVKTFSATSFRDRANLGEEITEWIMSHPEIELVDTVVVQSSDHAYHCLSFAIFYLIRPNQPE